MLKIRETRNKITANTFYSIHNIFHNVFHRPTACSSIPMKHYMSIYRTSRWIRQTISDAWKLFNANLTESASYARNNVIVGTFNNWRVSITMHFASQSSPSLVAGDGGDGRGWSKYILTTSGSLAYCARSSSRSTKILKVHSHSLAFIVWGNTSREDLGSHWYSSMIHVRNEIVTCE